MLLALTYLSRAFKDRRHQGSRRRAVVGDGLRVDAQASQETLGLGGWRPERNMDGGIDPFLSTWFHVRITKQNCPWAHAKDGETYVIASLDSVGDAAGHHVPRT